MSRPPVDRFVVAILALSVLCLASKKVEAQTCGLRFEVLKGLTGLDSGFHPRSAWGDLDGDGDLDLVVGEFDGGIRYYENVGTAASARLETRGGAANPLEPFSVFQDASPALADLDNDGDLDLLLGQYQGPFVYLENTGTASAASFAPRTGPADPFDGLSVGGVTNPAFGDLDADGDLDVVIGEGTGGLVYLKNNGSAMAPTFVQALGSANPFAGYGSGTRAVPTVGDVDGDGDLDVVVGVNLGHFDFLRNDGTAQVPAYVQIVGAANPLNGLDYSVPFPRLVDLDNDGDLDFAIGQQLGNFAYLLNDGSPQAPAFTRALGDADPLAGLELSIFIHPSFADFDGDGDLDATAFGSGYAAYAENTGTATSPTFFERFGAANPLESNAPPLHAGGGRFVDLDFDGDLDLAGVGDSAPPRYWENTGSLAAPVWVERTGTSNPFSVVAAQPDRLYSPELADLDRDGDFDLVVARSSVAYYRNQGTAMAPLFVAVSGAANPFQGVSGDTIGLGDFDGDGDLDAATGSTGGGLRYFRNQGSSTAASYLELVGAASPFANIPEYATDSFTNPTWADVDSDGDADLVFGERTGSLLFYRSTCVLFADGFESGGTSRWTVTVP